MSCFWTNLVNCRQACDEPSGWGRIVSASGSVIVGQHAWLAVGDPAALEFDGETFTGNDVVGVLRVTRLIYANSAPEDFYNCNADPATLIPGSGNIPAWDAEPAGAYQAVVHVEADLATDFESGWFINPEGGPSVGPDRDELSGLLGVTVGEGSIVIEAIDDITGKQYAGVIQFNSCI